MITPVEKYDNIFYKRDDLFCPYGDVNGGKVRQTIELLKNNDVKGIIAAVSVHSPTGPVVSRVAKEFNKPCIIAVGGTKPEYLDKLPMMKLSKYFKADIRIVARHGIKNVISYKMQNTIRNTTCNKKCMIKYKIHKQIKETLCTTRSKIQ